MQEKYKEELHKIAQALYDKKGFNILALDVRNVSSVTEFFLIAEGSVERHVQSLARVASEKLQELGYTVYHLEGEQVGDWIVVDSGSFIVHLFVPDLRQKYALEELWREGKLVDLHLELDEDKAKLDKRKY